jgi:Sugar (pentulose and hexulose) kinases
MQENIALHYKNTLDINYEQDYHTQWENCLNIALISAVVRMSGKERTMDYILSFDVGTSGMKGILVDKDGEIAGHAMDRYEVTYTAEGFAEEDPRDWWDAVLKISREIMASTDVQPGDVKGIVFATQGAGVIPIGKENGEVIDPAIIWMDGRAQDEANEIMEMFGGKDAFAELTGVQLMGKDVLPKVRWLYKHKPDMFAKMDCFLDVAGYLVYMATGEKAYNITSASAICYDPETNSMMAAALEAAGIEPESFPRLVQCEGFVGNLTPQAAADMGLTTEARVYGGTIDIAVSTLGSGMCAPGETHFYLGTSSWASMIADEPALLSHGGFCAQSAELGKLMWLYTSETACANLDWYIEQFYSEEKAKMTDRELYAYVDSEADKIAPGSDGLIFDPWTAGERSPVSDVYVRGGFLNLNLSHTKAHMLRSVYEGIAYNLRWDMEALESDKGITVPVVRILGGGTKSDVWMQIFADIFNRPVEVVRDTQNAGAIGAAFLAAKGLGMFNSFDDVKEWVHVEKTYMPDKKRAAFYESHYKKFQQTYDCLKDFYFELNKNIAG